MKKVMLINTLRCMFVCAFINAILYNTATVNARQSDPRNFRFQRQTSKFPVQEVNDVQEGDDVALSCPIPTAQENDPLPVEWVDPEGEVISESKILTLKKVDVSKQGVYYCRIFTNDKDKYYATGFNIPFIEPQNYKSKDRGYQIVMTANSAESLKPGGYIRRSCGVQGDSSNFNYEWRFTTRKNLRRKSKDIVLKINPNDIDGIISCIATLKSDPTVELEYRTKLGLIQPPTQLEYITTPALKLEFESYTPPFIVDCNLDPETVDTRTPKTLEYTFLINKKAPQPEEIMEKQRIKASTLGDFECMAKGTINDEPWKLNILQTTSTDEKEGRRLSLNEENSVHTAKVNGRKELHCELDQNNVLENELETVRWFYEGRPGRVIELRSPRYQFANSESVSILKLTNLRPENSGVYSCTIMRGGKRLKRLTTLIIEQEAGKLEVEPKLIRYQKNRKTAEFHCQIEHIQIKPLSLIWTFIPEGETTERPIPSNARVRTDDIVEESNYVVINRPTRENAGKYVCREPVLNLTDYGVYEYPEEGRSSEIILRIRPSRELTVPYGGTARFLCLDVGDRKVIPDWSYDNSLRSRTTVDTQDVHRTIEITDLRNEDNNTILTCHYNGGYQVTAKIIVINACSNGKRACKNEECLDAGRFCDGIPDCRDRSDESDEFCAVCKPNEIRCLDYNGIPAPRSSALQHWFCDGENDCGNNFDEANCKYEVSCDGTSFLCRKSNLTIAKGYLCDKEQDCPDGEDEECSSPTIVYPTQEISMIKMAGERIVLDCSAIGDERPTLSWRYNWGCIEDRGEVINKCNDNDPSRSTSQLIIRNFSARHAGFYTCEAVNRKGRVFAKDYNLILKTLEEKMGPDEDEFSLT